MTATPSNASFRLAVVEDDLDLNKLIRYHLEQAGYKDVLALLTGTGAFEELQRFQPHLVVLDVMLPGVYGTEILELIRASKTLKDTPVILLTARSQEDDRIAGLEAGADDYLTKPFSPRELVLRIQGLIRRAANQADSTLPARTIEVGPLTLNPQERQAFLNGEHVNLTLTEYQLLLFLVEHRGKLQSRDVLLQKVWGYEGQVNTRTVDTHIKRLRHKLESFGNQIETVHGVGYRLNVE